MASLRGVVQVLCLCVYVTTVSSSHAVFTATHYVIKPLVTDDFTLRCHLRDGATTAIIGKRHAGSEVNSQAQVNFDVKNGGQATSGNDLSTSSDVIIFVIYRDYVIMM